MLRDRLTVTFKSIIPILIGTAIYAFGLHMFVIPNQFMEGGVTGVAILLNYMFELPPSLMTLVINVPLFIIGWRLIGNNGMIFTLIGTVSLSFFLWIMELAIEQQWVIPFYTEQDFFLATLYSGVSIGLGLGIVFRSGATTGGSDILARIGNKLRGWPMGRTLLWIDAAVIGLSAFYIPREKLLYTLVIVFVAAQLIDFIQEGAYAARAFMIITEKGTQMADLITSEIGRGVTIFPAKGAYSQHAKEAVYCIVARQEARRLQMIVNAADPSAFIIISEVKDVLGEGFREEEAAKT